MNINPPNILKHRITGQSPPQGVISLSCLLVKIGIIVILIHFSQLSSGIAASSAILISSGSVIALPISGE